MPLEKWCTQGFAKSSALVSRVVALWVPLALLVKRLDEALLGRLHLFPLLLAVGHFFLLIFVVGCFAVIMEVLKFAQPRIVVWDMVVGGGTVSLDLLTLLSSGDDNIVGVTANVDHIAEVAVVVIEQVATMFLVVSSCALATQSPFLVKDPAALVVIHLLLLIFQLDGNRYTWWSKGKILVEDGLDFRRCYWS